MSVTCVTLKVETSTVSEKERVSVSAVRSRSKATNVGLAKSSVKTPTVYSSSGRTAPTLLPFISARASSVSVMNVVILLTARAVSRLILFLSSSLK